MDMFLKIAGLKGESKDKDHKDEIDVLSWRWGADNSGSFHGGGGGGAGKVKVQDLTVKKYVDMASPDLMKACMSGTHFEVARLFVRKAGEKPLEYVIFTMSPVRVTGILSSATTIEDDRLTETITLHFAALQMDYKEQTASGTGGARTSAGWDIAGNAPL
jgi:type VI secretion system secreted protein Hcp